MIYYEGIIGSRANNLHLPTSDYDFFCCSDQEEESTYDSRNFNGPSHQIHRIPARILKKLTLEWHQFYNLQLYFPSEIITKTELTDYLLTNREEMLRANSLEVYNLCTEYFEYVKGIKKASPRHVKRFVIAFQYANLLIQYAKADRSFEELFVLQGDLRDELLSIRLKQEVSDECYVKYSEMLKQIPSLKPIYEERQDQFFLEKSKKEMKEILHLNNF